MMSAHHAFDLLAFQGPHGSGWTTPIDLTFGGALPPAPGRRAVYGRGLAAE